MNTKLGRNDPCHCGSGKKYKRCHLAQDEQNQPVVYERPDNPDSPSLPINPRAMAGLLKELPHLAPKKKRGEFERLVAQTKPILAYMEKQGEIEAASTALEAHRAEFEEFLKVEEAGLDRAKALFAEESFAPLRFTAADIERAFASIGDPPNFATGERVAETMLAAILFLATKDRRSQLSMDLLVRLPEYVAAGRHLDGWLIQHCANLTIEFIEESNPFLFEMFCHGYDAWQDEQRAGDEALLREVGMDPARLRNLSMEEIDAWLQAQEADPKAKARMEAVMNTHPERRALAIAGLEKLEDDSLKLLERDDAGALLLLPAEIEPWLPLLSQRWGKASEQLPDLIGDSPPDEKTANALLNLIRPVLIEMVQSTFTPDRIQQLVAKLKLYRNELFRAGDKGAAGCAVGAITSLERENKPARNYFLIALCFVSIHAFLSTMENPGAEAGDAPPPDERPS